MPPRMTNIEWIKKHLGELIERGREIQVFDSTLECNEYYEKIGYWSALKLIILKNYVTPYLDIIGNQSYNQKIAYIDLFSGPGLNLLGKHRTPIPGSPLIPLCTNKSKNNFSLFVFCDTKKERLDSLVKRCEMFDSAKNTIMPTHGDANNVIKYLPKILSDNQIDHSLIFIDPEGIEFSWDSLSKLVNDLNNKCDLIINFPSSGIPRLPHCPDTLKRFLGPGSDAIPKDKGMHDWAIDIYKRNLISIGKDVSTEIEVRGFNSYHYHLIPAVRKTKSGSQWFTKIFGPIKIRVESFDATSLNCISDCLEGRQQSLDSLIK